jgi:dimethylamine monooxygenase subunit A
MNTVARDTLRRLFPPGDHRFQLALRRGDAAAFWSARDATGAVLAERRRGLAAAAGAYVAVQDNAAVAEAIAYMAGAAGLTEVPADAEAAAAGLEPDWVVLAGDEAAGFPVVGGAVLFPSSWSLPAKLGQPLAMVHDVVPGLQAKLGAAVHTFLARLRPGEAWERPNWGLAADAARDHHPSRIVPALTAAATLATTWLRVESQFLTRLPVTAAVLFGIRLDLVRLDDLAADPDLAHGLADTLTTMEEAVAHYKGLTAVRAALVRQLRASA